MKLDIPRDVVAALSTLTKWLSVQFDKRFDPTPDPDCVQTLRFDLLFKVMFIQQPDGHVAFSDLRRVITILLTMDPEMVFDCNIHPTQILGSCGFTVGFDPRTDPAYKQMIAYLRSKDGVKMLKFVRNGKQCRGLRGLSLAPEFLDLLNDGDDDA